jgi:hypothetical protein
MFVTADRLRNFGTKHYAAPEDLHIDVPLSNISIAFINDDASFIAPQIYPVLPVGKQSDKYFIFDKADWFRVNETRRERKAPPQIVEFSVSSESYFADNFALAHELAFEDKNGANADAALDIDTSAVNFVMHGLKLDWENRVASQLTSTSNVGSSNTLSGTDQWSDFANSDPFNDVEVGKEAIQSSTGRKANLMVIGQPVVNKLRNHPDIIDRIKYTQTAFIQDGESALLAQAFGVDRVLIGSAVKNTAIEDLSASMSFIWGKDVLIAHVAPTPGLRTASLGYAFRWTVPGIPDMIAERHIFQDRHAERIEVGYFQDEKIVASEMGYLIKDAVA